MHCVQEAKPYRGYRHPQGKHPAGDPQRRGALIDGKSGEYMESSVYVGVITYNVIEQQSQDKVKTCAGGDTMHLVRWR
jgi:DNA-directed RNA polymerase beta subunit